MGGLTPFSHTKVTHLLQMPVVLFDISAFYLHYTAVYSYFAQEFYINDLKKTQDRNYAEIFSCIALHCYYICAFWTICRSWYSVV